MGNLSKRVSRKALWEAFLEYGQVVDVYTPRVSNRPAKGFTFAFVRYKLEFEMWKAIENGNNRRVDGRFIRVKKASYGWTDRVKNK